jgi:hypothetical protein
MYQLCKAGSVRRRGSIRSSEEEESSHTYTYTVHGAFRRYQKSVAEIGRQRLVRVVKTMEAT